MDGEGEIIRLAEVKPEPEAENENEKPKGETNCLKACFDKFANPFKSSLTQEKDVENGLEDQNGKLSCFMPHCLKSSNQGTEIQSEKEQDIQERIQKAVDNNTLFPPDDEK